MNRTTLAPPSTAIEQKIVDTVKTLSIDAVQAANSGHPGMPMGGADFATVLWTRHLRVDPAWPEWPGRDRFVLSAGHGSMLLYSMLHLSGFDLPLDEIRNFRQWGSLTPGHPEYGHTAGVETTTGPLGQGFGNAVGMALAERLLAARFPNRPGGEEGHRTFAFASDGDLMEGIASEAASLAGHLRLGRLTVWYDANEVTIDGSTDLAFTEDVGARFRAYGWHVVGPVDGHDREKIDAALNECVAETGRPSLIIGRTRLGHGSPNYEGTSRTHGAPLGADEVRAVKEKLGLDPDAEFDVPEDVRTWFRQWADSRAADSAAWREAHDRYRADRPEECAAWEAALADDTPADLLADPPEWETGASVPTRKAGHAVLQKVAASVPWLVSGSADLLGSNLTGIDGAGPVAAPDYDGRVIYYGVREHAMGAAVNGMVLHGGVRAVGATFLVFADYMRPSLRLAALMGIPAVHVFSHDSIYVGEDGPTHQPIEHLDSLRIIPNLHVLRPADARETVHAWKHAMERKDGPSVIVLTRQGIPVLERQGGPTAGGAGIVHEPEVAPRVVLAGSGSEVWLCARAAEELGAAGIPARAVSVPCLETFAGASPEERDALLPGNCPRLFVEAGTGLSWQPWIRPEDAFHGIQRFGASAPGAVVAERLGLTPAAVAARARALLEG